MNDSGFDPVILEENYRQCRKKVSAAQQDLVSGKDRKQIKESLIRVQQEMKNLKFNRDEREELWNAIQSVFEQLHQAYEADQALFEHEAFQNYSRLKTLVENAVFLSRKAPDVREAKAVLIEAQQEFKGLRMIKEQREELYQQIQREFDRVNGVLEQEKGRFQAEAEQNYTEIRQLVEEAVFKVRTDAPPAQIREFLIQVQNELKGKSLLKEHREEMFQKLQDAFSVLNMKISEEKEMVRLGAEHQYEELLKRAKSLLAEANTTTDFKTAREELRHVQTLLKESQVFKEQRDILYQMLQDVFQVLNQRQDEERSQFETEAAKNYTELARKVAEGLNQAHESSEYKETREFLKKIQAEFKGRKLIREQREELYSRLQSAFDVLNKRVDTFFREKKKNWEVRMQFKLTDLQTTIGEYEQKIERENEILRELETQLDNISSSGRELEARDRLTAKILSVGNSIRRTQELIRQTETEMESIRQRLTEPESEA